MKVIAKVAITNEIPQIPYCAVFTPPYKYTTVVGASSRYNVERIVDSERRQWSNNCLFKRDPVQ